MVRGALSRISSAHVIALIALLVSLGGGAYAFSGSGTLQKAGVTGISSVSFEDIRTLNGFGTLQAQCDTGDDEMRYRLDNTTSSSVIKIHAANEAGGFLGGVSVGPGNQSAAFESNTTEGSSRVHLFKEGATSKSGVEIVISNDGPFANDCGTAEVRVMALNTVE